MVSIVLPVYNAEKYIRKSIESVLKQTYPIWELIIIDNGSEDDSFSICHEYAKEEQRIVVFHQYQNKGVSAARNLGVEKSSGEYITFLDADDWLDEDYLERLVRMAEEAQTDLLVCKFKQEFDDKEQKEDFREEKKDTVMVYQREKYIEQCLLNGYTHCWGVLYKASILERIYFPSKLTIGEDVLFLIDTILQAEKIGVTTYDGYHYYINENGAMNRKFTPSYMDQITCWKRAKDKLIERYPNTLYKINSIIVVSTMLVVGKLSCLSKEELGSYGKELEECQEVIKEYSVMREVIRLLPSGYPLKVFLFKLSPAFYMKLYSLWKK